jgi:Lrp/AsnC family transcriptional regulator, leucine-responsive regulatory protein
MSGRTPNRSPRPLDRIDRLMLQRLQVDGRIAVAQLAREVHLSLTPCAERLKRLEDLGYIRGYAARLDPVKLEQGLLAYVQVQLDRTTPEVFERFRIAMLETPEVMECQMVAGGFDYLLKIRVRDMEAFRQLLGTRVTSIAGVQQTHTYFVMEEVKSTHAIKVADR